MKLEKENKKELFHLYWIIQGIILIFGIKGIGNLPLIGGSYLKNDHYKHVSNLFMYIYLGIYIYYDDDRF